MLERFKKPKIVKVESAYLQELNEFFVDKKTLLKLSKHQQIVETPGDFHTIIDDTIFTYLKPNGTPKILQVSGLEIHPDHVGVIVHLTRKDLFLLANRYRITVMETKNEFIIPLGSVMYKSEKEKEA
jgi:hypothetical protein